MAKRWNGKKMSHGRKNLHRPTKKPRVTGVTKDAERKRGAKRGVA